MLRGPEKTGDYLAPPVTTVNGQPVPAPPMSNVSYDYKADSRNNSLLIGLVLAAGIAFAIYMYTK